VGGIPQAVQTDHVGPGVLELAGAIGGGVSLIRMRFLFERHRGDDLEPRFLGAASGDHGFCDIGEGLGHHEVDPRIELDLELAFEDRAHALCGASVGRVELPRQAQVSRHQCIALFGHRASDLHRGPVEVFDLVGETDRSELLGAGIERERL
jgi:hypothetical protein